MHSLEVNPSVFNQALLSVLKKYKLITVNPYYRYLENNSKVFNYLSQYRMLENLSKSIKGRLNQSVNTEYFKITKTIIESMARDKGLSIDSCWEIVATETNQLVLTLLAEVEAANKLESAKQAEAIKQQKEHEELVTGTVIVGSGALLLFTLVWGIGWGFNAFNQNIFNNQEVRRLTTENQNLKSKAAKYDQYLKDIESVNNTLAEIDELAECKRRPIWNPCR